MPEPMTEAEIRWFRFNREVARERFFIVSDPDLESRRSRLHALAATIELVTRALPELHDGLGIEIELINDAIAKIDGEMRELREDGEGWKLGS